MLKENYEAIKWLISVSQGNRIFLVLSITCAMIGGCISILPYILFFDVIKSVNTSAISREYIFNITVAVAVAIVLKYVLLFTATMFSHRAAFFIQCNVRKKLLEHVGNLPLGFFTKRSSGLLRKIASEDVESLEIYIAHHIPDTALSITIPLAIFGVVFSQNLLLALVLLIPLVFMFFALNRISKIRKENVKDYFDNMENMNSATVEYVKVIPIIKIFNVTVESFDKFNTAIQKQIQITSQWIKKSSPFYVVFKSSLDFVLPLLMFMITYQAQQGVGIPVATYFLCFILGAAMVKPVNQVYTSSNLLCSLMEGARRVGQITDVEQISDIQESYVSIDDFTIKYESVFFSYSDKQVLSDISMDFDKPGLYALVGESGSGKTTAVQLLLRFREVTQGNISIGNVDIKQIPLAFLLRNISFVFQDSFILDGSVRDNICMGLPDISDLDIIKVAKVVEAHGFIKKLPNGYDTMIGGDGSNLSGGEKQRICLARALLKDSPILVLDEPTSQVDATIERRIFDAIKHYCPDKIILFITHRITAATNADIIFVFNNGKIVDFGRHSELMTQNKEYRQMWDLTSKANTWSLEGRS